MTKRDIVVKISSEVSELDVFAGGKFIELRNFGVFEVKIRKSRKGRNPNKPKNEVVIPERVVVKFRAGKELKERVEKLKPRTLRKR